MSLNYELMFRLLVWLTINLSAADLILLIGLTLNIVGTFLMAFSITFGYEIRIGYLDERKDDKKYAEADLVKFNKYLFRCGIYTLGLGFIFQFTSIFFRINS